MQNYLTFGQQNLGGNIDYNVCIKMHDLQQT